jgi:hypothetical protein
MGEVRSPRRRWLLTLLLLALGPLAFLSTGGLDAARRLVRGADTASPWSGDASWSDRDEDADDDAMVSDPARRAANERASRAAADAAARRVHERLAARAGGGLDGRETSKPHRYRWAERPGEAAGTLAAPDASAAGSRAEAPPAVRADAARDGAPPSGTAGPGRGAPIAPPEPGAVHFDWDYTVGGQTFHCSTTVTIDAGDGVRRGAQVTTTDDRGQLLVSYRGTAFVDAAGQLEIDARQAPVSGPWAGSWSPDSFAVDEYGAVRTLDDFNRGGGGWVTSAGNASGAWIPASRRPSA